MAECERGFSMMNLMLTDVRSSPMMKQKFQLLMFIQFHGRLISPYIKALQLLKHRTAADDPRMWLAASTSQKTEF
jgi:hypothetical protein